MEKKPVCSCDFLYVHYLHEPEKDEFPTTKKRKCNLNGETETSEGPAEVGGISTELREISPVADKNSAMDSMIPSTELTLFDESWIVHSVSHSIAEKREESDPCKESLLERKKLAENIGKMSVYTDEEREEEKEKGVSTELKLHFDPWPIKKRLTSSDVGNLTRLLVPTDLVDDHILCFFNTEMVQQIRGEGVKFDIWDWDTQTEHQLVLKLWHSSNSYVFINGWIQNFKKRRNLGQGDLIGLYWDPYSSRFNFSVLERAEVQSF